MKKLLLLIPTLILTLVAEEQAFRFAWFSDTHIGSSTAAEDLRQAIADVNTEDVDFTIISGDITELDINGYLDTAKVILDKLLAPYYIIPGNHDTKWSSSGTRKFIDPRRPIEKNGRIFFGTKDGFIYALDAITGHGQWRYRVGVGLV
ncbi:MAG: metallophosphoesterase, partial [Candidatus Marinimicrobia bacterium]|nr:metallophosphoesterase [Candidatus Neomarinimicrobiota bacterium]